MKLLLDEMLPPAAAKILTEHGHDAATVVELGLAGAADAEVFDAAVASGRVMVTEDVADCVAILERRQSRGEDVVPVVFVSRSSFPRRGALAAHLARRLDRWAADRPDPYVGPHWL